MSTLFQSTPSTRRETREISRIVIRSRHFNPLPPHGGRLCVIEIFHAPEFISIHSLHTEGDIIKPFIEKFSVNFNPLPPHGGRPTAFCVNVVTSTFQSTPSTRRETSESVVGIRRNAFQSTPSTRRETYKNAIVPDFPCISIHSLHTEGDHRFAYGFHIF